MITNEALSNMFIGVLVGALITTCLCYPRVARAFGKVVAVITMGAGVGLITWGLLASLGREEFSPLTIGPMTFFVASQVLGCGAGCLAAGITALVLACAGKPK